MSVVLIRKVSLDDIQLLRSWRNLEIVRKQMQFVDLISRDEQRLWFHSLKADRDSYFIYSLGSTDVGCVNLKKIDEIAKSCESGIFCGSAEFFQHWVNGLAYLWVCHLAFDKYKVRTIRATVNRENHLALGLNQSIGFRRRETGDSEFVNLELTYDDFVAKALQRDRLLKLIKEEAV